MAPAAPPLCFQPLNLQSEMWSAEDRAEQALFALLIYVPSNLAFVALCQLATTWTRAHHFGPQIRNMHTLIAQELAADMLVKGFTPMDVVLLYASVGGPGYGGLQFQAVSTSLLANHFAQVGLKLQGPVPITYLYQPLHMYFYWLNMLGTVEK